jgi:two-component system NtrC family sensor kinase
VHVIHFVLSALLFLAAGGLGWGAIRLKRRLERSERERRRTADELNRRLSELFSLQELSYILSGSLQLERIVEQIVRYAMRFLDAKGALLALVPEAEARGGGAAGGGHHPLHVAAAQGSLAALAGRAITADDPGLVGRSLASDRLELVHDGEEGGGGGGGAPAPLLADHAITAAAAVPLRAHGVHVGTLVIADPRDGAFAPEDVRLLSTVATHAAIVIANAQFFEMVRHAKEQWETAFDSLSEGIAVVDEAGRVRRANRSLATMLGAPIPGIIGLDLGKALLGPSSVLPDLLAAVRRGERVQPLVVRSPALGRTIRVNAARIPPAPPAPAAVAPAGPASPAAEHDQSVVVLVEDVTDQQAMEAQLIQSEKLAAVGQLVSGVAHELNNPLTSIAGLSEFLLEQKELGAKDRGHLRVIHEQADRAGRIVRSLLTFARKGAAEQAPVDLNDVVQRTLLLMSYDMKLKGVTIEKTLAPVPAVLGDRRGLQQVVLNLLNNAAQAVAGNPAGRERTIHLSTWFDDRVRLRIADTGPGIPDDVLPQLFTPFFTTKEPGQGTGLGLSITYSIVEAHGGRITVERPAGGGAAFLVDLPPAPADTPAPRTSGAAPEPLAGPVAPPVKRTILLVDDDPAVRRMVKALFAGEGHAVEVARSAAQALELVRGRGYDLILADAQAAGGAGGAGGDRLFVEQLVEAHPELRDRVIVATGDVRPATEAALARLGLRYVRKPFNLRDLRDEAARVWAAGVTP